MDTNIAPTTAALRARSESSFVVPMGAEAFWQLVVSHRGGNALRFGTAYDVPTGTVNPMVGPDARVTAKQARPPRGVPR